MSIPLLLDSNPSPSGNILLLQNLVSSYLLEYCLVIDYRCLSRIGDQFIVAAIPHPHHQSHRLCYFLVFTVKINQEEDQK